MATATFAVPAADVWAYRLNFTNLPEYNPDVTDVERIADGAAEGVGGVCGVGARYRFQLADSRHRGRSHPVELWTVDVVEPTLVVAGMLGGNEAYEEFAVTPLDDGGCHATLTLWVTLPDGLSADVLAGVAAGGLAQIDKELVLMKEVLESPSPSDPGDPGDPGDPSVH